MLSIILFILILMKLEMLNGLPLALIIIMIVCNIISFICKIVSKLIEVYNR